MMKQNSLAISVATITALIAGCASNSTSKESDAVALGQYGSQTEGEFVGYIDSKKSPQRPYVANGVYVGESVNWYIGHSDGLEAERRADGVRYHVRKSNEELEKAASESSAKADANAKTIAELKAQLAEAMAAVRELKDQTGSLKNQTVKTVVSNNDVAAKFDPSRLTSTARTCIEEKGVHYNPNFKVEHLHHSEYDSWRVKRGDTLWAISGTVYGSPVLWPLIYDRNEGVIGKNPHLIYPGQQYTIDQDLVVSEVDQLSEELCGSK